VADDSGEEFETLEDAIFPRFDPWIDTSVLVLGDDLGTDARSVGTSEELPVRSDTLEPMAPLPHASPRLLVGLGSLVVAVAATWATRTTPNAPRDIGSWPRALLVRLRTDLRRGGSPARRWVLVAVWSLAVTVLHFGGLALGVYSRLFWWDLLTHATGGAGVAAVLFLGLRDRAPARTTPWWLVAAVFAVGAWFEVYEFVFKSFWYGWSLRYYALDTAVDIVVNATGAVAVVLVVAASRRLRTERPRAVRDRL
jgi:hypothetical protein